MSRPRRGETGRSPRVNLTSPIGGLEIFGGGRAVCVARFSLPFPKNSNGAEGVFSPQTFGGPFEDNSCILPARRRKRFLPSLPCNLNRPLLKFRLARENVIETLGKWRGNCKFAPYFIWGARIKTPRKKRINFCSAAPARRLDCFAEECGLVCRLFRQYCAGRFRNSAARQFIRVLRFFGARRSVLKAPRAGFRFGTGGQAMARTKKSRITVSSVASGDRSSSKALAICIWQSISFFRVVPAAIGASFAPAYHAFCENTL